MTVTTTLDRQYFDGNGSNKVFPFNFRFFTNDQIYVSLIAPDGTVTPQSLTTNYTLTGALQAGGGTVTMIVAPPFTMPATRVFVQRILSQTQPTSIRNQGKFYPEIHEDAFDRLTMLIQQALSGLNNALQLTSSQNGWNFLGYKGINVGAPTQPTDAATKDYVDASSQGNTSYTDNQILRTVRGGAGEVLTQLPPAASRANKVMGFDASGQPVGILPASGSGTELAIDLANPIDPFKGAGMIGYFGLTLADAMNRTRSIRTFGAVGAGADDTAAINSAETWLATSTINRPLCLVIDIPVRYTQQGKLGAITLIGISGWTIQWLGSGKILMDNLNAGLGTGGGLFASGPAKDITTINLNIEWVTKPTTRSTGDGFMFKGYPSDENCIENLRMLGRNRVKNAPQTSGIALGCKDPYFQAHVGIDGAADNLHLNACLRPVVMHNYGIRSGDDVMALVTYWHPTDIGGGGANWQTSRTPYNQPTLGEWNNTDFFIAGVSADNCNTNAGRLGGANGGTIGPIKADGTARGFIADAGIADGVQYKWSYLASRKIRIESVTEIGGTIGAFIQVFNRDLVLASADPTVFTDFDISVGPITSRSSSAYGAQVYGANNVTFDSVDSESAALAGILLQYSSGITFREVLGNGLITVEHACSNIQFGDVECNRVVLALGTGPSSDIRFGKVKSTESPVNAFRASRVAGLTIESLSAKNHNTSNGAANNAALEIQACTGVDVGGLTADSIYSNAKLLEIGGGSSAEIRANDVRISKIHGRLNRTDSGITIQGGAFGPLNIKYDGKWKNTTTGAWTSVTADTYA